MRGRIPMTAKEMLLRGRELGHELEVQVRTRADFPDAPPKIYVGCKCGWEAGTPRRSVKAANQVAAWHLGFTIGEALDVPSARDGVALGPRTQAG